MGIDKKTSTHICNVIRRQIQSKFPNFTLIFIIHEEDTRIAAVKRETRQILRHPAGQQVLDYLSNADRRTTLDKRSKLIGLADSYAPGLFGTFGKHHILAAFFINASRFDSEHALRNQALHMTWHALALRQDYLKHESRQKNNRSVHKTGEAYEIQNGVIRPKLTLEKLYQRNLMADIFAASIQYLEGQADALRLLAGQRMTETLTAKEGFIAERYPYPVSIDTLTFLFENTKTLRYTKSALIEDSISVTEEIGQNYTIPAVAQWRSFSHPAQHMAWLGFPPPVILGTAIYTSENSNVRAIADMVVEVTGIDPEIVTAPEDFNPFISIDNAQKAHVKACHEAMRRLMLSVINNDNHFLIYEEARQQNQRLLLGNPCGWCAYPLLMVAQEFEKSTRKYDRTEKERFEKIFDAAQAQLPYERLLRFAVLMFQRRRDGHEMSLDDMMKAAETNPDFETIYLAIEKSQKSAVHNLQRVI